VREKHHDDSILPHPDELLKLKILIMVIKLLCIAGAITKLNLIKFSLCENNFFFSSLPYLMMIPARGAKA